MAGPGTAAVALLPAVLLALLAPWAGRGVAAAPTAPNDTLEAELERRWESLVARSLARLPVAAQPKEAAVQSGAGDYLLGIKRLRRLYCNVGIGFHLQVFPDGRIGGVHSDTSDSEWGGRADRVGDGEQQLPLPTHTQRPRAGDTCSRALGTGQTRVPVPCDAGTLGSSKSAKPAGTGSAHPARAPPPRLRKPRLRVPNSSAFPRGHRAHRAATGTRGGPGHAPRLKPGLGAARAAWVLWRGTRRAATGWTREESWGRPEMGSPGPFPPHPPQKVGP
jgi:hypothetical protein